MDVVEDKTWNAVPHWIIGRILSGTGWSRSVSCAFRLVCKDWCHAHDALLPILQPRYLQYKGKTMKEIIPVMFPNVQEFGLFWCLEPFSDSGMPGLAAEQLTMLSLKGKGCREFSAQHLASLLSELPALTSLNLKGLKLSSPNHTALFSATGLVELNLACCAWVNGVTMHALNLMPSLTKLDLSKSGISIENRGFRMLASVMSIKDLSLARCCCVNDDVLFSLGNMTSLTSLNIAHCSSITDFGIQALLSTATNICHLSLQHCGNITDAGMIPIISLPVLLSLNLNSCGNISDNGLGALSNATTLEYLDLGRCAGISPSGLEYVLKLTRLRDLNLLYCHRISHDDCLRTLSKLRSLEFLNEEPMQFSVLNKNNEWIFEQQLVDDVPLCMT